MNLNFADYLLILLTGYCIYTDIRDGKIYNYITFPLMLAGIIYNICSGGMLGLQTSIVGILVAFAMFISVSIFVKGVGYGDVKLLMAIGSFKGFSFCLDIFFLSITISFIVKLITKRKQMIKAIKLSLYIMYQLVFHSTVMKVEKENTSEKFIFGPYIFIGLLISLYTHGTLIINFVKH